MIRRFVAEKYHRLVKFQGKAQKNNRSVINVGRCENMGGIVRTVGDIAVEGNETLWKYFRLERFLSTLAESRLYFASANQFIDPFEGAVAVQLNVPPPDPRYAEMESVERAFFQLKRLTKISCLAPCRL